MQTPDLSYLSADPAMTQMPANLQANAQANLAREDATVGRFNAVASQVPGQALPTDVAPTTTSTTTAPVPDAPSVDPYLVARHAALQQGIANGIDPDAPAKYVNPNRRKELLGEFYHLTDMLHQNSLENADLAKRNFIQNKDIVSSNQFAGLVSGLAGLTSKPGTDQHATDTLNLIAKYPEGAQTAAGQDLLRLHAAAHDTHRNVLDAIPSGSVATLEHIGPSGPSYNVKPVGPNVAAIQPADEYASAALAQQENPDATIERNPGTGGFYPKTKAAEPEKPEKLGQETIRRYAAIQADLADPNKTDVRPAAIQEASILESKYPELKKLLPKAEDKSTFDTPDEFSKAYATAPSGSVLKFKGKPYRKP